MATLTRRVSEIKGRGDVSRRVVSGSTWPDPQHDVGCARISRLPGFVRILHTVRYTFGSPSICLSMDPTRAFAVDISSRTISGNERDGKRVETTRSLVIAIEGYYHAQFSEIGDCELKNRAADRHC